MRSVVFISFTVFTLSNFFKLPYRRYRLSSIPVVAPPSNPSRRRGVCRWKSVLIGFCIITDGILLARITHGKHHWFFIRFSVGTTNLFSVLDRRPRHLGRRYRELTNSTFLAMILHVVPPSCHRLARLPFTGSVFRMCPM